MVRILRGAILTVLITTLVVPQAYAIDEPLWLNNLKQVHELSSSYEVFAAQAEQDYFEEDFRNIRKRWAGEIKQQYIWLLFRQYMAQLDTAEYQLELIKGSRDLYRSSRVVYTLAETSGLGKRHSVMKQSLKDQPFVFENFMEVTLYSALALSEMEKVIPKLEATLKKLNRKQGLANEKRMAKLQAKLREYNGWKTMIFDTFPPFQFLLGMVPLAKRTVPFYTKIKSDYLRLINQGVVGPELLKQLTLKNQDLISQQVALLAKPFPNYSLRAMRSLAQPDYHFFMRHFALRTDTIDRIKNLGFLSQTEKLAFETADKNLSQQLGIPDLDTLLAPRQMSWGQAGINAGFSLLSAPLGFSVGFGEAFHRYLTSYLDTDAFRIGSLMGINPYALYDASTKQPYLRVLAADTLWVAMGARSVNTLGKAGMNLASRMSQMSFALPNVAKLATTMLQAPKNITAQGALDFSKNLFAASYSKLTNPVFLRTAGINILADMTVTLGSESLFRGESPLELLSEPGMRLRLTQSFIGGFLYIAVINEKWSFTQFAFASSALSFANTTASMILWGQKMDSERLLTQTAYTWLIGAVMTKYMFVPLQKKYVPYFGAKYPKDFGGTLKSKAISKELLFRLTRGTLATGVFVTSVEESLHPFDIKALYEELYQQPLQTPAVQASSTLGAHPEVK